MSRCQRCGLITVGYTDFCTTCQVWLDRQGAVEYDEGRVLGFAEVASWALYGEPEKRVEKWRCW